MNRQTLIVLGGGLMVALLVALIMQSMMGGNDAAPVEVAEVERTRVLIASKNLNIGDELDASSMEWKTWPADAVFENAIIESELDLDEGEMALNGRLKRNVTKGEPLLKSAIVENSDGSFVSATLGKGMRAMAIRVKAETAVAGFLAPNDRVDVIMTYDVRLPSDETVRNASVNVVDKKAAQTVLENIRVVAVDQKAMEVEDPTVSKTVTLEVDAKQAEMLALADSMGGLSLALRQLGDDKSVIGTDDTPLTTATTDTRMSNVVQELLGNGHKSGGQPRVIKVYNGATVTETVIRPSNAQ